MGHHLVHKSQVQVATKLHLLTSQSLFINNFSLGGVSPYAPHGGAPGLFLISIFFIFVGVCPVILKRSIAFLTMKALYRLNVVFI